MTEQNLDALIEAEIAMPAPPALQAMAEDIARRHDGVLAILFYGSCRRTGDFSSLADLYVLYRGHRAFHGRTLPALLNALLPPNVSPASFRHGGETVRAKVAVMSARQFGRRMHAGALDTTVWTRFAQPASLIYVRDEAARRLVFSALGHAIRTAVFWARKLAPSAPTPAAHWQALFAQTYRTELRAERETQPQKLYEANASWFDAVFAAVPRESAANRAPGRLWLWRRLLGRPLNLLRLLKAAFTFENGADYIAWKLARHGGVRLTLTDWQRRHPILAAPGLLWRLRRTNAARRLSLRRGQLLAAVDEAKLDPDGGNRIERKADLFDAMGGADTGAQQRPAARRGRRQS